MWWPRTHTMPLSPSLWLSTVWAATTPSRPSLMGWLLFVLRFELAQSRRRTKRILASAHPRLRGDERMIHACLRALLQQPRDRGAQLGDAGAAARRGRNDVGKGCRMLGERRLRLRKPAGELGVRHLVDLGEHD